MKWLKITGIALTVIGGAIAFAKDLIDEKQMDAEIDAKIERKFAERFGTEENTENEELI